MNEKIKLALMDSDLWFPNYKKVSEKTGIARSTIRDHIVNNRKSGKLKINVKIKEIEV
jgi:hypothetical protein